jgi:hypothetical protein
MAASGTLGAGHGYVRSRRRPEVIGPGPMRTVVGPEMVIDARRTYSMQRRSSLLTIFWHCGFSHFSSRTDREAPFGNQPSTVLAEDSYLSRVWQC